MPPSPPPLQGVFLVLFSTPSQPGPPNSASRIPVGNGTSQSVTLSPAWLPYLQHMGSVHAAEVGIDHLQTGLSLLTHAHTDTHTHIHPTPPQQGEGSKWEEVDRRPVARLGTQVPHQGGRIQGRNQGHFIQSSQFPRLFITSYTCNF